LIATLEEGNYNGSSDFNPQGLLYYLSMAHGKRILLAIGLLFSLAVASLAQDDARIWTDKSGKHQIRAKFVDIVDGVVRLERPNGDISRIPVEKLSDADQGFIQGLQAGAGKVAAVSKPPAPQGLQVGDRVEARHFNRWEEGVVSEIDYDQNHVEVELDSGDTAHFLDPEDMRYPGTNTHPVLIPPPSPESSLKAVRPNYDDVERLVADGKVKDHVAADPVKAAPSKWQAKSVRLGGAQDFFESPSDFDIRGGDQPLAMVVYENNRPGKKMFPRVDLIDMQRRKVVASGPAPTGTAQVALSPSGKKVVTLAGEHPDPDDEGLLHFWKIDGKKVEHLVGFSPYVMNTWPHAVPSWCTWLDEERLFTANDEGQLILWRVNGATALYELRVEPRVKPTLSPGGKYLVVPTSSGIQFFDAATGEYQALIGTSDFSHSALGFSPSGKQLAIATPGFIDIIDVTTGETTRSFPYDEKTWIQEIGWIDENYLFTNRGLLIHVPLRIMAWNFEIPGNVVVRPFGNTFWMLLENRMNNSQILTPLELPPQEAISAVKGLKPADLLAVTPGATIAIDVQIPEDNFLAEGVKTALHTALEEAGMKVGNDTNLKLLARTKTGETQKVSYRDFHAGLRDPGQTIDVTSRIYELELQMDGATIWRRNAVHSAPHMVHMQQGESIHEAVARIMKPTAANFAGRLPAYVVRPEYLEPLGSSRLSLGN
jgi:DNA-binding beta-propeller fold protein YncE